MTTVRELITQAREADRAVHAARRYLQSRYGSVLDSGAVVVIPVAAAVRVLPPAASHAVAPDVGAAGSTRPGACTAGRGALPGESARPVRTAGGAAADSVCLGPDGGSVRRTGSTALPAPAWFCPTCDDGHYGECPALASRRSFLTWLLDKIGRPA